MTPDPIRSALAPLIWQIGIRETGRRACVPHSTLAKWLSGERGRRPSPERLARIAQAVGATLETETCDHCGATASRVRAPLPDADAD